MLFNKPETLNIYTDLRMVPGLHPLHYSGECWLHHILPGIAVLILCNTNYFTALHFLLLLILSKWFINQNSLTNMGFNFQFLFFWGIVFLVTTTLIGDCLKIVSWKCFPFLLHIRNIVFESYVLNEFLSVLTARMKLVFSLCALAKIWLITRCTKNVQR